MDGVALANGPFPDLTRATTPLFGRWDQQRISEVRCSATAVWLSKLWVPKCVFTWMASFTGCVRWKVLFWEHLGVAVMRVDFGLWNLQKLVEPSGCCGSWISARQIEISSDSYVTFLS